MNDFKNFKQEAEKNDGVRIYSAGELIDPKPNYSGSYSLDYDLVIPFPEGRITEIYGMEGTCKTSLALEIIGQALLKGKKCLYVNMERNLNLSLMKTIRPLRPYLDDAIKNLESKNNDCSFWIVNAENGEQALETMRKFANMVPEGIAVLDSIDAAQPEAVLSGEIGENKMGNLAKLMSDAMHKLIAAAESNRVALIFINQIRQKMTMYGDPNTPSGGFAVRYYATQRIELLKPRKDDIIEDDDKEKIGINIRYKIVKNKVAPDGIENEFCILLKNGIFRERELINRCLNFGILKFGGQGGKQVLLPVLKDNQETGEFIKMKQFDAARRLILDTNLYHYLANLYSKTIDPQKHHVDTFINEIFNSQEQGN